jgi:Skp family chaperone for outer membrane proteins
VTDLVDRYGSRAGVEKEIRKFERKGTTTRNQLERDVRKARTRLERELRGRRRDAERLIRREAGTAERQANRRRNMVSEGIATVSNRVEGAVQIGVATGGRVATLAKERVSSIA